MEIWSTTLLSHLGYGASTSAVDSVDMSDIFWDQISFDGSEIWDPPVDMVNIPLQKNIGLTSTIQTVVGNGISERINDVWSNTLDLGLPVPGWGTWLLDCHQRRESRRVPG